MIGRFLLALSFPVVLFGQTADYVARITTTPYDAQKRVNAVVEVEAKVPVRDRSQVTLDILGSFIQEEWSTSSGIVCEKKGENWLHCGIEPMSAGARVQVSFRGAPWFSSGKRNVYANLQWTDRGLRTEKRSWDHEVFEFAHEFVVTQTGDSGPGSFRQAIEDAKAVCIAYEKPCLIRFDAGAPAVIRPLTPLPPVRAMTLIIDGGSNVTLDGSLLAAGNGLELDGVQVNVTVRGLTIDSFPGNGFQVSDGQFARVLSCAITRNGSRGVAMVGHGSVSVEESVVSGNARSGVFGLVGSGRVIRSLIGVAADGVTPMPNGASGIFADGSWTILDNVIAYNGHWGVATHPDYRYVDIGRNRIAGNVLGAIDVGLDGPSFFTKPPGGFYVPPNAPALLSATYDAAANETTVTGRLDNVEFFYFLTYEIQFWATSSANEAEDFVGAISIDKANFTAKLPGDLRGRFITANTIRYVHDEITDRGPSELSSPIQVQ
jgi:hypothetical protein